MSRFLIALLALSFTFLTSFSLAAGQGENANFRSYKIQASLFDDGRLIGQPVITLRHGEPVIMTVAKNPGYSLRLVATELPADQIGRRVSVNSEVYLRFMGSWRLVAAPNLAIPIGSSARFELGAAGRRDKPTGHPFKVQMSVVDFAPTAAQAQGFKQNACSERKEAIWRETMANKPITVRAQNVELQQADKCCKSGNLTCCGGDRTCCSDGVSGNACCV